MSFVFWSTVALMASFILQPASIFSHTHDKTTNDNLKGMFVVLEQQKYRHNVTVIWLSHFLVFNLFI